MSVLRTGKLKRYTIFILLCIAGGLQAIEAENSAAIFIGRKPVVKDSTVFAFLLKSGVPVTHDNKIKLLQSGKEKFINLFADIRQAKHHIHLEYFNFRNDSIGKALFDLLAVKARDGVQIRVIFDAFGNWSNDRPLSNKQLEEIRSKGIEIVKFDPIRFPYVNHAAHRDHRKIVVIDGLIGYTGGMNVADYYIDGLPKIGLWHDMHIRVEGGAVCYLQDIFLTTWNKSTKQDIVGVDYFPPVPEIRDGKTTAIVDRAPRITPELIRHTYAQAIRTAKRKIQIVNPYFLPTRSIKQELKAAIKRGIEVEIMMSTKSDIPFTPEGSVYILHRLMKLGAEVYLYNGGFHHSKIMMIDDAFCTVGTANLNSRSLRYDYEVNAFIFDKATTRQLCEQFEKDKAQCTKLTPEIWKERSKWKRFVGWVANLLTPVL